MPTKSEQKAALAVIEEVEDKIYVFRGQRVMFDSDLAEIYQVETRVLKQAVRRNRHRFPDDFLFELTADETALLERSRSQTVTLNRPLSKRGSNIKYAPFAFTEHGAVMLASVLKSQTAVEASIVVVRAFVRMRAMLALHQDLADRVEELEKVTDYHGQKFGVVSDLLSQILRDPKFLKRKIGFVEAKKGKK
ncbi:MAG: ORF6N domain-containing protein [Acidobacteria bacterium]|nr:ORF6N domain-containing protein [Acidobacteriota bacterium]